ncbi:hypothetical protein MKY22_06175 [Exiguobacterium sp. FSL W8-0210]|uniref:hypothetical protein n=1 Tax=unclassified Exiguobacterium TaxID=2644629 RepID=UPI000EED2284|nr:MULTISPECIES: hypothetical protein [unclassified Exiguobacterium]HCV52521.1 hypothetical protein [Exiguobacterium sp.]
MANQHDKETDPITSGNRMTKDEIAGRDPQDHTNVPESSKEEKESKHQEQEQDAEKTERPDDDASSEEAPDLSHASDEDGDVQPSDEDQQDKE